MTQNEMSVDAAMQRLSHDELQNLGQWTDERYALDNLYAQFATLEQGPGAVGGDPVEAGKAFLRNLHARLSDSICHSTTVRRAVQDPQANAADSIALAAVIAALIDTGPATIVNSGLAAALIVRLGVRSFCATHWQ